MRQTCALAHHFPGLGDPMSMDVDEFYDALEELRRMNERADS